MDKLDVDLLRFFLAPGNLQWDVRASFAEAGRALGVKEDTVRSRFTRLRDSGVIRNLDVFVHPTLFGMQLGRVECDVPARRKADVIEKISMLDGARLVFDYLPDGLTGVFYVPLRDGLERTGRLVQALSDAPVRATTVVGLPPMDFQASTDDWRLVQALRAGPRVPYPELAKRLGVAERTVRRRHQRLVQGRALFLGVDLDFRVLEGRFSVEARAQCRTADAQRALRRQVEQWEDVVFKGYGQDNAVVSRLVTNPYEVTRTREAFEAIDGVDDVRVDIVQDRLLLDDWLDREIARRVAPGGE